MRILLVFIFVHMINSSKNPDRVQKKVRMRCGLQVGDKVTLSGELLNKPKILSIGFVTGKLRSPNVLYPFYLNVNFKRNILKMNDLTRRLFGKKWGEADEFGNPLKRGEHFKISIEVDRLNHYVVFINNNLFATFSRIPLLKTNYVAVAGDFKLEELNVLSKCVNQEYLIIPAPSTKSPNPEKRETTIPPTLTTVYFEESIAMFEEPEAGAETNQITTAENKNATESTANELVTSNPLEVKENRPIVLASTASTELDPHLKIKFTVQET